MQRKLHFLLRATTVTAASALTLASMAADTPAPAIKAAESAPAKPQANSPGRLHGAAKASDVLGMTVKNKEGITLGTVTDLAVDVESGRLVTVILTAPDSASGKNILTAVPPTVFIHDVPGKVLHLDTTAEKLAGAPKFMMDQWAECCSADHLAAAYTYYGAEKAFNFVDRSGAPEAKAEEKKSEASPREARHQSMIPVSRLALLQRASKLMGTPVTNKKDEKLGKVDNVLVDFTSGRLVAVIISSGAYLGIAEELSAVPPTALRFSKDRTSLWLDTNKESLAAAPHFSASAWPDFTAPAYSAGMHRAYKQEPYFAPGGTTQADNTARNKDDKAPTPMDQGNSKADIATTAEIRRDVMALDSLSLTAKNVKIITNEGKVTLRGPVNTAAEKQSICDIADRIAKAEHVDNQLEVKLAPGSKE